MSSPGQRRGSYGHVMAGFDTHSKCARCRDKGLGDDPCVQKKECVICRGFNPEQIQQLPLLIKTGKTRRRLRPPLPLSWTLLTLVCWVKWRRSRLLILPLRPRRRSVVNPPSLLPIRRNLPAVNHQLKI